MNFGRRKNTVALVATGLFFFSQPVFSVFFEPGAGVGLEYTDNARLTADAPVSDLITTAYVGARVTEDEGALRYGGSTSFNKYSYTQGSYEDQRFFNLAANADWEMIRDRFNWFLSDTFSQNSTLALGNNTPDNIQNINVFAFGANARLPVTARQEISLTPMFSQYYFERLATDNRQYSLSANWNYQMFRLTNVGLGLSARKIDYTQTLFGRSPDNTTFTSMAIIVNGQRLRSNFMVNLGATNVKRENSKQEATGFTGFVNWTTDLSSRSMFEMLVSTDISDAGTVAASGGGANVQITADVIRTSVINLAYSRDDATLNTRISARYNKLRYSESPLNRIIKSLNFQLSYPMTQLLSTGAYINYFRTDQLDINRQDNQYTVGGNMRYKFSRKLSGLLDLKYRTRDTIDLETTDIPKRDYDEYSVFVSLVYGFGQVGRPTRVGGF